MKEKGTFDKRYNYHFQTASASAYQVGMPLKFSGFVIGTIDDISLKDDGNVFMTFSVVEKNKKWIAKDSVLMLRKPLIGSAYIEVFSAIGNKELKANSTLSILESDDINDMISKLEPAVDKIIKIIDSVDKITYYMARDDSEIHHTLKNMEIFSSKLAKSNSLLTTVTGDKNSTQNLIKTLNDTTKLMQEIQKISKDISKITSSLDGDIIKPASSTAKELDAIMKDVKQKLNALDGTVKTVGSFDKDLVDLKDQISVGLAKSNQIMDKVDAIMQDNKKTKVILP
jgi:ABC-type transporter Mla subunit MlaD